MALSEHIDYSYWSSKIPDLREQYLNARPFSHIVLDNFLSEEAADLAHASFPGVSEKGWIHYVHVNEKKHGLNKMELLPEPISHLIRELNSPDSLEFLRELTGYQDLIADEMLEGGGLHQTKRGGFLNVHADFTVHPHKPRWRRRVNLLIYLNKDWQDDFGGDLELWDRDMKECKASIAPLFNRCVIFNTDESSYHGVPEPLNCPEGQTRKSIALYYFTEEDKPLRRSTGYRARPKDGLRKIAIRLDTHLVNIYTRIKGALGLKDDAVSRLLSIFDRKKS